MQHILVTNDSAPSYIPQAGRGRWRGWSGSCARCRAGTRTPMTTFRVGTRTPMATFDREMKDGATDTITLCTALYSCVQY